MAKTPPIATDPAADSAAPDKASAETAGTPKPTPPATRPEHGFFRWIRSIGLVRETGWIGGVCAGIAARLGIDPLIVRGIAVVVAAIGGPAVLLYAIAWLLLPDRAGQIHAQEVGRGHVTPAFPAIVALGLLSLLPLAQGVWWLGGLYWGVPDVLGGIARALWTLLLIAAIVGVVVWLARRADSTRTPAASSEPVITPTTTPATTDDRPDSVPSGVNDGGPVEPAPAPANASDAELADWQRSQDEWRTQRAAWVLEQNRAESERRQAERRARSEAWAAANAERRRVRALTRPRAGGAVIALIIGLAILCGAGTALAASTSPDTVDVKWALGIAAATLVVGLAAVVVGFARRRSGFLAFLGIIGVMATITTAVIPVDRHVLSVGATSVIDVESSGRYIKTVGYTDLNVVALASGSVPVIDLWQGAGEVQVDLAPGATVRIEAAEADGVGPEVLLVRSGSGTIDRAELQRTGTTADGTAQFAAQIGAGSPDAVLRIWLGGGTITIAQNNADNAAVLPITPAPDVPADVSTPNPFDAEGH